MLDLCVSGRFLALVCQYDVPKDCGEDVVEVVRDATGQMPDRLHLLGLPQLLLQTSALGLGGLASGNVPCDGDRMRRATIADGDGPNLDEEALTALADSRHLDLTRLARERTAYKRV